MSLSRSAIPAARPLVAGLVTSLLLASPGLASAEPPASPPGATGGTPRVHIRTDAPGVALHEVTRQVSVGWNGGDFSYGPTSRPICIAPCDQIVDAHRGQRFFFTGAGIRPSPQFQFVGRRSEVVVDVKAGSSARYTGGTLLAAFGGAAAGLGGLFVGMGTRGSLTYNAAKGTNEYVSDRGYQIGGGIGIGVGVGLLAAGITLIVKNATRYSFVDARRDALILCF